MSWVESIVGACYEPHMEYELLYIIPATFTDEDVGQVEANVKALLEKNEAAIGETERLGKFRFAYPIKKIRHGHYILVMFKAEPGQVGKIDESLRLANDVLRHLILRAEEAGGKKFNLVQFTEVNLEAKDEQRGLRRERISKTKEDQQKSSEEIKSGVAMLEQKADEAGGEEKFEEEAPAVISDEELDKKLDAVLREEA